MSNFTLQTIEDTCCEVQSILTPERNNTCSNPPVLIISMTIKKDSRVKKNKLKPLAIVK